MDVYIAHAIWNSKGLVDTISVTAVRYSICSPLHPSAWSYPTCCVIWQLVNVHVVLHVRTVVWHVLNSVRTLCVVSVSVWQPQTPTGTPTVLLLSKVQVSVFDNLLALSTFFGAMFSLNLSHFVNTTPNWFVNRWLFSMVKRYENSDTLCLRFHAPFLSSLVHQFDWTSH